MEENFTKGNFAIFFKLGDINEVGFFNFVFVGNNEPSTKLLLVGRVMPELIIINAH
jgi:hypothetical protein